MIYTIICLTRGSAKFVKKRRAAPLKQSVATTRDRPKWYAVCDAVGRDIIEGKLRPGGLLPIEADLARELGVSRPSLREGLRALAAKGLVETRTRRGTIVRPKECWDILDSDILAWMANAPPDQEFLMALLELRTSIEPVAARLAAQRASPRQVLGIEESYRAMAASLPDDIEAGPCKMLSFRVCRISGYPRLFSQKGSPTMADADRLGKIASIGQDLITTQLTMAMQTPSQALEGTWVLGYCFGIFDALAQRADLDDGAEGFSLITLGFLGLFADPADPEAAAFVSRSLDSQDNPRFQEGAAAGGSDVFAWVADRAKAPNALFEHLTR